MNRGLRLQYIPETSQISIEIYDLETKKQICLPVQIPVKATSLNLMGFMEAILVSVKREGINITQIEVITDPDLD
jgi:hypothetical protein